MSDNTVTEKDEVVSDSAVEVEDEATRGDGVEPEETAESSSVAAETNEDALSSDYFDDDLFLAAEDSVVHRDQSAGVIEQLEHVVSWQVDNFYGESGKPRNRFVLRQDPPIFKITSSRGDSAEFIVTKSLAKDLEQIFKDVHNGFYGISPKTKSSNPLSQESISQGLSNLQEWAVDNKLKAVLIAFVAIVVIISPFVLN